MERNAVRPAGGIRRGWRSSDIRRRAGCSGNCLACAAVKDCGRLKRDDALKIRGKVVGFQYEPYLQKNLSPVILAEGKRKALHTFNENMREGQTYDFLYLPSTGIAVVVGEAQTECD